MFLTGQSIAAAANAVTKNGKSNTLYAFGLLVGGTLIILGFRDILKKKDRKQNLKHAISLENTKHKYRIEEASLKNELKKEIIDYRRESGKQESIFNLNDAKMGPDEQSVSVETYDEIVSGEDIQNTSLRLGLRCFHIGEDCGLIGRTNIGKTTFALQFAMAIASGYQEEVAKISPEWTLEQQMKVLYFAFEQNKNHFKSKYGRFITHIPNLYIDIRTSVGDYLTIQKKIMKLQNEIGNYRLLVIFDNITKMKSRKSDDKRDFFQWLEDYRIKCGNDSKPITYLKIFHTVGAYKDHMLIDATTNYGDKTDTFFSQDLVAFGKGKGGDGKLRYIKELKNKLETGGEKTTVSVYKVANTSAPMFDYVEELEECDVLPSKYDLVQGIEHSKEAINEYVRTPGKRGRNEEYSHDLLMEMAEEHKTGFSWREIMDYHDIIYDHKCKDGINNKAKGIKQAMKRHGIIWH